MQKSNNEFQITFTWFLLEVKFEFSVWTFCVDLQANREKTKTV